MATNPIDRKDEIRVSAQVGDDQISPNISPVARAVLEAALTERPERSLNEALASMPNVGLDSDFDRHYKG